MDRIIRFVSFIVFVCFAFNLFRNLESFASDPATELSKERLVFRTDYGDIAVALFPKIAPEHTHQIIKLARLGVYNGTHFYRVEPGFVAQVSTAQDRDTPMTPEQESAIKKIKAEFSSVPHTHGILSMARNDNDPDSAETSFSILLGSAPHLDEKYTIFGQVVAGMPVLDEIENAEVDQSHKPLERIRIVKALVFDSQAELDKSPLLPVTHRSKVQKLTNSELLPEQKLSVIYGLTFICILASILVLYDRYFSARIRNSLSLLILITAAFFIIALLTPLGQRYSWIACLLFFGFILVIRMLGLFDREVRETR